MEQGASVGMLLLLSRKMKTDRCSTLPRQLGRRARAIQKQSPAEDIRRVRESDAVPVVYLSTLQG